MRFGSTDSLLGRFRAFSRTFSFRVMWWLFVISIVMTTFTTTLSGIIVSRSIRKSHESSMKDNLEKVVQKIVVVLPDDYQEYIGPVENAPFFAELSRTLKELTHPVDWFIVLFDNGGKMIFRSDGTPELPPEANRLENSTVREEKDLTWITAPFPSIDFPDFRVTVVRTQKAMREEFGWLNFTLWLRGIFGLAVAPLVGYLIARRMSVTMMKIIDTAKRLEPEKLAERLPIAGTGDEMDVLSETINNLLDRVGGYIERHRVFVANAAHELRSPLAAIRSSSEVALNRDRTPAEYAAVLGDMVGEVDQLASMVNRLLLLAESDAGRFAPTGSRSRLDALVRETADMFVVVAESQDVKLRVEPLPVTEVRADDAAIRHILRNLIDNAIKFSSPGAKVEVRLRTERSAGKDWAVLEVIDQGIGISADDLPRLFERFFRGDKARDRSTRRSGSGLGLSICHSIVTALKGDLQVASELGKGTTVTVRLPISE